MIRVSFQGERGAYSEAASLSFFEEKIETIPLPTFTDILENTKNENTEYSVLPVENSLEGSVGESYDLLYSTELYAVGEIYHRIRHCLIGSAKLEEIDTVYSHPQALGQCRRFIQENKMKTVPTYDTAGSVKIIKEINKPNIACIASKRASEIYEIATIKEGIEDNSNNYTRFLVLSKNVTKETGKDKTSIILSIKHEAGALHKIIEKFYQYSINLTKIESRPKKNTVWEYNFYIDFEGHKDDESISKVLNEIKEHTIFFKILGSYPSADLAKNP